MDYELKKWEELKNLTQIELFQEMEYFNSIPYVEKYTLAGRKSGKEWGKSNPTSRAIKDINCEYKMKDKYKQYRNWITKLLQRYNKLNGVSYTIKQWRLDNEKRTDSIT